MKLNNTNITSPLIKIKKKEKLFLVNGQFLNEEKIFDIKELRPIIFNLFNDLDIKKIQFSSINDFSFNINNKLKLKDLKVKALIDLKELTIIEKNLKLKSYFPSFDEELKLKAHKLVINYDKDK